MSSTTTTPPPPLIPTFPTTTKPPSPPSYISTLGLGYSIAIALGFLVLFSTILLASYICCRAAARRRRNNSTIPVTGSSSVYLPRIIFVSEEDDDSESQQNVVVGLDQQVINSYPRFVYSRRNGNDTVCSICLCEYREAEMLRMLPDCRHCFHLMCVDAWLKLNASCPVCRNSPLPTPLSTPLQEVVPLSQYGDGRRRQ